MVETSSRSAQPGRIRISCVPPAALTRNNDDIEELRALGCVRIVIRFSTEGRGGGILQGVPAVDHSLVATVMSTATAAYNP
jgi:hypothetical protein